MLETSSLPSLRRPGAAFAKAFCPGVSCITFWAPVFEASKEPAPKARLVLKDYVDS